MFIKMKKKIVKILNIQCNNMNRVLSYEKRNNKTWMMPCPVEIIGQININQKDLTKTFDYLMNIEYYEHKKLMDKVIRDLFNKLLNAKIFNIISKNINSISKKIEKEWNKMLDVYNNPCKLSPLDYDIYIRALKTFKINYQYRNTIGRTIDYHFHTEHIFINVYILENSITIYLGKRGSTLSKISSNSIISITLEGKND